MADLYGFFPGTHAVLDNLYLDGSEVTFDATKCLIPMMAQVSFGTFGTVMGQQRMRVVLSVHLMEM